MKLCKKVWNALSESLITAGIQKTKGSNRKLYRSTAKSQNPNRLAKENMVPKPKFPARLSQAIGTTAQPFQIQVASLNCFRRLTFHELNSSQRIMKSLVCELGVISQIDRKNTHVFYWSQNFALSTLTQEFKAPSGCRRHSAHHKRKPPHERIVFYFFLVLLSFCCLLFYVSCVIQTI